MFYEYALDPAVLSRWDKVRYFLDAFGPWKGRLLAEFPRKGWRRMAYEASIGCPDVERSRIEERLRRLDRRVFTARRGAQFDVTLEWLDNARIEHTRIPFRAILALGHTGGPVLDADALDESNELWRVESGRVVPRDERSLIDSLALLLAASKNVIIVDPYFRADQDDKARMIAAFANAITPPSTTLEVHFAEAHVSFAFCVDHATRRLPKLLRPGTTIVLKCWRELAGGKRLHNRYVLSEVGGVQFGDGIEIGDAFHDDRVSILDEPSRVELWNQYVGAAGAFEAVGAPVSITGV